MDNKAPERDAAAQRRKRYPLLPYLLVLLVTVVIVILLSYFSRMNSQALMKLDAEHDDNIEIITDRLDSIEARIGLLEEKLAEQTGNGAENSGETADAQ